VIHNRGYVLDEDALVQWISGRPLWTAELEVRLFYETQHSRSSLVSATAGVSLGTVVDKSLGTVSALLWNYSEKAIDVNVHLKNLPTDGKVRRYLLNTADRAFDDTARLQAQPMQKVSKGEGLSSFRLEPWGLTMISIAKF
jgi:hypothetical protein